MQCVTNDIDLTPARVCSYGNDNSLFMMCIHVHVFVCLLCVVTVLTLTVPQQSGILTRLHLIGNVCII